jgi:glycosyltransferase involved in cell wall biosynthesis
MRISVITPTGGRPEAFALLERWVSRQTRQPDQWIVVDDCVPPTRCTMDQHLVVPRPPWQPGENTQHRNLQAAIPLVTGDAMLIMEDDDWYAPGYIAEMEKRLELAVLVGEGRAHYYQIREHRYMICKNEQHASLAQTGMRRVLLPLLDEICGRRAKWVDLVLWASARSRGLWPPSGLQVSLKGMPGRIGIGSGHHQTGREWNSDEDFSILRAWLGEDAEAYKDFV